jgi:hypothetical protein
MRKKIQEKDSRIYHFYRNPISRKKFLSSLQLPKRFHFKKAFLKEIMFYVRSLLQTVIIDG